MNTLEVYNKLREPFSIKLIKFKPQSTNKEKTQCLPVAFIDARDVSQRLDDAVGPHNWEFHIQEVIQNAKVASIVGALRLKVGTEWIQKSDIGEASQDITSYKAAASDALKRCAVQFGVFRYAYDLKFEWTELNGKKMKQKPALPYWALSESDKTCEACGVHLDEYIEDNTGNKKEAGSWISQVYYRTGKILCYECAVKRAKGLLNE